MNTKIKILALGSVFMITSCSVSKGNNQVSMKEQNTHQFVINTPEDAIVELKNGNERFLKDKLINTDYKSQIEHTKEDQHPHTVFLSCLDSRVPPEIIFDQGIGNVFVARNAGNIEDLNVLGSMEFATKVKGTKLIVVMGHTNCGAIKGVLADAKLENLTQLLDQIKPAIIKNDDKDKMVDDTARNNVKMTIADILKKSSTINELVKENKVKIVGAYYDLATGKVIFME
jgi:carbonic anhydrase